MQETEQETSRRQLSAPSGSRANARETGIARTMQILDFLHRHQRPIALAELARKLDAPRSTTYNLVRQLEECGLLEVASDDGRLFFGQKVYLWGLDYIRENALVRRGREMVDALAESTGETAELCMLRSGRYTIVHMCPGARPFRISSAPGLQIPLPWTATGRLLLAGMPQEEIDALVPDDDYVLPDGGRIEKAAFLQEIADASERGYCVSSGLVDAFTKCLAAAVYGADGSVAATLCFVVPIDTPEDRVRQLCAVLMERSREVSLAL